MSRLQSHPAWQSLPQGFPDGIGSPRFNIGHHVHWNPLPSRDFGIVTGLEYAPADHLQAWSWRYVVRLDPQSPSSAWVLTDTAWEDDLELLMPEPTEPNGGAGQE
jgi:hypothetical protein